MKNPKWIQQAGLKKGSLKRYVKEKYGGAGFTDRGTIKSEILNKIASNPRATPLRRRQASLAKTLRKLH